MQFKSSLQALYLTAYLLDTQILAQSSSALWLSYLRSDSIPRRKCSPVKEQPDLGLELCNAFQIKCCGLLFSHSSFYFVFLWILSISFLLKPQCYDK